MDSGKSRNKIEIKRPTKFPEVLVVTPLSPLDYVSKITKKTIQRNIVKYFWITSQGDNNIPTNYQLGLDWAKENIPNPPKYCIMIDNDIELGRHMLDRLYDALKKSDENTGFAYAGFEFKGAVNHKFPADPWNLSRLIKGNYISSNSMFKMSAIDKVGLVTDDKYKRLLDWAFLLKCASYGYHGLPVPNAEFIAKSEPGDISAGSNEDYKLKHKRVYEDFVKPFVS
jgi:hypothetical protein